MLSSFAYLLKHSICNVCISTWSWTFHRVHGELRGLETIHRKRRPETLDPYVLFITDVISAKIEDVGTIRWAEYVLIYLFYYSSVFFKMSDSPDARSLVSASSQLNLMEIDAVRHPDMFTVSLHLLLFIAAWR